MQQLPRPYPRPDRDTAPFWEAHHRHELRLQRCSQCAGFRYPVTPLCPHCHSFDFEWTACSGRGTVYSYTVVHHQTHPAFAVPYTMLLVELDEGPRLIARMRAAEGTPVKIGMKVCIEWEDHPEQPLPVFAPA